MGPEATVELMARIVRRTPARDDADHIRLLVDNNPKVPSRIRHLIEKTGVDPGPVLADMARGLEQIGASLLAVPCNTAHYYLPAIRAAVSIPVLDMVGLSLDRVAAKAGRDGVIALLASPAVQMTKLFDRGAEERGIQLLHPVAKDAETVLAVIRAVKAGSTDPDLLAHYHAVVDRLQASDACAVVLACTELSVLGLPSRYSNITLDTLDALVDAILAATGKTGLMHGPETG